MAHNSREQNRNKPRLKPMKTCSHAATRAIFLAALAFTVLPIAAQVPGHVAEAAGSVGQALGPQALAALVSVEGHNGLPQPKAWDFTVADPSTRNGVRVLRATPQRAVPSADRAVPVGYPLNIPGGFFRWSDVRVDSTAAFAAADREARAAMVGFDSVHYLLRVRDGTTTPVWTLTLLDVENRAVGRLEVSAVSGQVERRVWLRYAGPGSPALIRIEDSASPFASLRPAPIQPAVLDPATGLAPAETPPPAAPDGLAPAPAPVPPGVIPVPPVPGPGSLQSIAPSAPTPPPAAGGYTPLPP